MDHAIQVATVLAAFAAVYERVIELIQHAATSQNSFVRGLATLGGGLSWVNTRAIDQKNVLLAIALAFTSHASLLDLFVPGAHGSSLFFDNYMQVFLWPWQLSFRDGIGCVLMGLSTGLGSKFWHDLVGGLTDLRGRAQAVTEAAAPRAADSPRVAPPSVPPTETISQGVLAGRPIPHRPGVGRKVPPSEPPVEIVSSP